MTAVTRAMLKRLNSLYRLCAAGAKGFAVVAANAKNRGLKMLLYACAQQRAQLADELRAEIQRLGGRVSERGSIRGLIHRGRIDILATFSVGEQGAENVALGEAALGEQAVIRAYRRALATPLPAETRALLERQAAQIEATRDQVDLWRGKAGKRLVVRLFDSEQDAQAAVQALKVAGFGPERIEVADFRQVPSLGANKGSRVTEAILSGAVGGALWGSLIGALAGLSALSIPELQPMGGSPLASWAVIAVSGIVCGGAVAALLGLAIGLGISEEDAYLFSDGLAHGVKMVKVLADNERALQAAQIMRQVNASARARPSERAKAQA